MRSLSIRFALVFCFGVAMGTALPLWQQTHPAAQAGQQGERNPDALTADVETLKGKAPDQSHAMSDVAYHYGNLWFAGQAENWPLATFYLSETKSHLNWAVRIIPVRKDNLGREIDLKAILQSVENVPLKQLDEAIKAENKQAFSDSYRTMLEACYSCHKAADKPFLRPQVPDTPQTSVINFDPHATWPK
jgi:hypothetical protein